MPASAVITLDTTPPDLSLGDPVRPAPDLVYVPYTLSADGEIIGATLVLEETTVDLAVLPDRVEGFIPQTYQQTAYIYVIAQDDVWNLVIRTIPFVVSGPMGVGVAKIRKNPRADVEAVENPTVTVREKKNPRADGQAIEYPWARAKISKRPKA